MSNNNNGKNPNQNPDPNPGDGNNPGGEGTNNNGKPEDTTKAPWYKRAWNAATTGVRDFWHTHPGIRRTVKGIGIGGALGGAAYGGYCYGKAHAEPQVVTQYVVMDGDKEVGTVTEMEPVKTEESPVEENNEPNKAE